MFKKSKPYVYVSRSHEAVYPSLLDDFEPFIRRVIEIKVGIDGVEKEARLTKDHLEWLLQEIPDET